MPATVIPRGLVSASALALGLALCSPAAAQTSPAAPAGSDGAAPAGADGSATSTINAASNSASGANSDGAAKASNQSSGQLEEIVVTAQKRSENLQKVPLSVVAIGGPALEARGITNVLDLGKSVSGLTIAIEKGVIQPFLRGVGASGNSLSIESKVAIYADGVYFARLPNSFLDLKNVERVEVLKGPQGTLFGRNSTGGVINIVTKDPSHDPSVQGSVGYGNYQQFNGDLYATTGLSDKIALDFSISGNTNDGYGKNITTGHRYEYEDSILTRSKLLIEPTDSTHIVFAGFYNGSKVSGTKGGFPGTAIQTMTQPIQTYRVEDFGYHNAIDDTDNHDVFHVWGVSAHVDQELPFAKLTSISAYTHHRENSLFEGDRTPRPDFYLNYQATIKQFTQELQLSSLPGSSFSWITGLYYYNNLTKFDRVNFFAPTLFGPDGFAAPAQQKVISYAGFAQATYEIVPRLKLTGGIRYTSDKTSAAGTGYLKTTPPLILITTPDSTTHVRKPTYKASLDYQVTTDILVYGLYSHGFKSGNYNILTYNTTNPTKPETIDDYEGGFKADLFDRHLRLNAAAFYYKIRNPQVQLLQGNPPTVFFSNAGGARVKGAELDGQVIIAQGLTGRFSGTYLDSKYTKYVDAPASTPDLVNGGSINAGPIDAKGNRTPLAAKVTFNVGGDYSLDTSMGQFLFTVDYFHNSGYYYEPDNLLHQKAYDLVNGQIRFKPSDRLAFRLWAKNLLDKDYTAAGSTQLGPAGYGWAAAPPRTFGGAVDFNF